MQHLSSFSTSRKLAFASSKGSVTLLLSYNKDFNKFPNVFLNKEPLTLNKNPKTLSVTFDPTLCFAAHCKSPADKARHRIDVMKALAGSSSVQSKETLTLTYKALIRSYLARASSTWAHAASKTSINYMQVTQNRPLRVIIDSTLMSSTAHLHTEVEILKSQTTTLTSRFLISTYRLHHSHQFYHSYSPPRQVRQPILIAFKGNTRLFNRPKPVTKS